MSKAHSIAGVSDGRPASDFYPTPRWATEALLDREDLDTGVEGVVWEPACGMCDITNVFIDREIAVVSSDLFDYGSKGGISGINFLTHNYPFSNDLLFVQHVVTNPPFRYAQSFAERALEVATDKVALLLKLSFLEGQKRKTFFESSPLKSVYVFSKRVQMGRSGQSYENGTMFAYAWYVWDKSYQGKPQIEWI